MFEESNCNKQINSKLALQSPENFGTKLLGNAGLSCSETNVKISHKLTFCPPSYTLFIQVLSIRVTNTCSTSSAPLLNWVANNVHATTLLGTEKYLGGSESIYKVSEGQGQLELVQAKAAPQIKTLWSHPAPLHSSALHPKTALMHTQSSSPVLLFYLHFFLWKPHAANKSQIALICNATDCNMLRRATAWQTTQKSGLGSNLWNKCKYPETFCYFSNIKLQVKQTYCQIFIQTRLKKKNPYKFIISNYKQHRGKKHIYVFRFRKKPHNLSMRKALI